VIQALREGHFGDGPVRAKDAKETGNKFAEFGLDKNMMRKIYAINGTTVLVNDTKGIQNLHETRELIIEAFNDVCKKGPIAEEPLTGVLVRLVDAKLHEDAIHRGPAQTIPAVRNAIKGSLIRSNSVMFEPIQKIRIDAPNEWIGGITREVTTRRGIIEDMPVEGGVASVIGKMPVAESFGFSNDIRAATQGRAVWNTENAGYVQVPSDLFHKISGEIRQRKGLKEEIPGESQYTD
jgi:elongation factor 2